MKLIASGWSRNISNRTLFEIDMSKAQTSNNYEWNGLTVQHITKTEEIRYFDDVHVVDGPLPALGYRFRMHVGESTMSGEYSVDLLVGTDDVLSMFKQAFGNLTIDELLALMTEK